MKEGVEETLKFLPENEKKIVEVLVEREGEEYQSKIVDATGFNRAKVSRKISKLVDKGVLKKDESGMSNLIKLEQPFQKLYVGKKE